MISGFGCYIKYLSIKSHFTNEKYDYFKYQGKVRADQNSFIRRNDRYFFEKIAKKLQTSDEIEKFFISSIVEKPTTWIGDVLDDSVLDNYFSWKKKIESITYTFKQDIDYLIEEFDDIKQPFQVYDGQHPVVLKLLLKRKINIESLIILDHFFSCFENWNNKILDRIVWPEIHKKCLKYKPFLLRYIGSDRINEFKTIIKDKFSIDS